MSESVIPVLLLALSIANDLEAGEELILLTALRDRTFIPHRDGKKLDKSVPFRWASRGCRGIRLEVINTPTGKATTRSAVLRFFAALSRSRGDSTVAPTPRSRRASVERARRELEAAGI